MKQSLKIGCSNLHNGISTTYMNILCNTNASCLCNLNLHTYHHLFCILEYIVYYIVSYSILYIYLYIYISYIIHT